MWYGLEQLQKCRVSYSDLDTASFVDPLQQGRLENRERGLDVPLFLITFWLERLPLRLGP
jgi:hypothetical protein